MRMNISVPDEMKARMDAVGQETNWSAVAQRAFERQLKHLEIPKEIKSMQDVVQRLRASKKAYVEAVFGAGTRHGVAWAKINAEYPELRNLASINPDSIPTGDTSEATLYFFRTIYPDDEDRPDYDELVAHFEFGDDLTPEYIRGFVEGAQEVWNQVGDQL